jgi:phosphonate transport system substrate-binding protein
MHLLKAFIAVLILFSGEIARAQSLTTINFGLSSAESTQNLRQDWQPLLDDMAQATGLRVVPYFVVDKAAMIDAFKQGKVQVAWLGNKASIEAVDYANAEVFAQMVDADGEEGYYSLLITHSSSPLKSLDDVLKQGKRLTYGSGDPISTSGFLVPSYYVFAKNNIDMNTHFRQVKVGNHETNALRVANRMVDVAAIKSGTLEKIEHLYPNKFKDIRVIWKSPLIPMSPLIMRKDLSDDVKRKVKDFIYSYGKKDDRQKGILLKIQNLSGFKPSDNKQLIPIRRLDL